MMLVVRAPLYFMSLKATYTEDHLTFIVNEYLVQKKRKKKERYHMNYDISVVCDTG